MIQPRRSTPPIVTLLVIMMVFGPGACIKSVDKAPEPKPEIVWPPAPEVPRIRFVAAVSKPDDLQIQRGVFQRLFDYLIGKSTVAMVNPYGVETDAEGRLYVVDTFLRTVLVFDVEGNKFYPFAAEKAKFLSPIDIAIDNDGGRIFITDSQGGAVKIFHNRGEEYVTDIGQGQLERPTGVAVNRLTSELLVVDTRQSTVFRFDLGDFRFKGKFGRSGTGEGQLHYPTNIYVTEDGTIYVTDSLNFRVQIFSSAGKHLGGFGSAGQNPGYFARPRGVAVDSDGNIYVVDGLFDNIQIFDGQFRLMLAIGSPGHEYGQFWLPTGISIDADDKIYVSDSYNKRVQIFQYLKKDNSDQ